MSVNFYQGILLKNEFIKQTHKQIKNFVILFWRSIHAF